jgi:hypothetical protein
MAMQPIDLQTLFTQLDKVARSQTQQREGLQIQAALNQIQSQKKAEEHVRSVNEAQDMGYGTSMVKDEKSQNQSSNRDKKEDEEIQEVAEASRNAAIRDPTLGRNIDISG